MICGWNRGGRSDWNVLGGFRKHSGPFAGKRAALRWHATPRRPFGFDFGFDPGFGSLSRSGNLKLNEMERWNDSAELGWRKA